MLVDGDELIAVAQALHAQWTTDNVNRSHPDAAISEQADRRGRVLNKLLRRLSDMGVQVPAEGDCEPVVVSFPATFSISLTELDLYEYGGIEGAVTVYRRVFERFNQTHDDELLGGVVTVRWAEGPIQVTE